MVDTKHIDVISTAWQNGITMFHAHRPTAALTATIRSAWRILSLMILFALLTVTPFTGDRPATAEDLFTRTDELMCSDVRVKAVTTCTQDSQPIAFAECRDQHFFFINQKTGVVSRLKGSGSLVERFDAQRRKLGKSLNALATEWACFQGKGGMYIYIGYGSGGSCVECEWDEIHNLRGKTLASDRGSARTKDAKIIKFNKTYDSLGLPQPWPRDSVLRIQLFKGDR
jgi:hypothetical protein